MITQDRLRELLEYNPVTGVFLWKQSPHPRFKIGDRAGGPNSGYWRIKLNGEHYYAHRLAFLYMEGWMPEEVDHRDLNRSNNAWKNLRPATRTQQNQNRPIQAPRNKLGVKGVSYEYGKYRVKIRANRQRYNIGTFDTLEEAKAAYEKAVRDHHGDFARAS